MDRISELPDQILHQILSRLCAREACQTSILSKTWLLTWKSFPRLDFNQAFFRKELDENWGFTARTDDPAIRTAMADFMKHVDASLERFIKQQVLIKRFNLSVSIIEHGSISLIDRWISVAVKNSVEELNLSFRTYPIVPYTLPQTIFDAASLRELCLFQCKLDLPSSIKFTSLRKLSFHRVRLDEQTLDSFIANCPCIENFILAYCPGLSSLKFPVLEHLKSAEIVGSIDYLQCRYTLGTLPKLSSNLRYLHFWEVKITDQCLHDIIAECPQIETLNLGNCNLLRRLKISSNSLSDLKLICCNRLAEIQIEASNLRSFAFVGEPISSFFQTSPLCSAKIILMNLTKNEWMKFLSSSLRLLELELCVSLSLEDFLGVGGIEEVSLSSSEWKIGHLKLEVDSFSSPRLHYPSILDGLLGLCKPKTLSILKGSKNRTFIEYVHQRLKNEARLCSLSYPLKCWWHFLRDVEMFDSSGRSWEWDKLTDLLWGPYEHNVVHFSLQWGSHKCEMQDYWAKESEIYELKLQEADSLEHVPLGSDVRVLQEYEAEDTEDIANELEQEEDSLEPEEEWPMLVSKAKLPAYARDFVVAKPRKVRKKKNAKARR